MNTEAQVLWGKIQQFPLDEANIAQPFSKRLAQENGWTPAYALRVVAEYKKFVFLSCISPTGASPSHPVDAAWHLHLTYTKAYWGTFCRDTLGRELHHAPTKGGQHENQHHRSIYEVTLQLYRDQFGQEPPADIWPASGTRLPARDQVLVDRQTHWIWPKPGSVARKRASLVGLVLVALLFVQADDSLAGYLIAIGGLALVAFAVYFVRQSIRTANRKKRKKTRGPKRTTNESRLHQNSGDDGLVNAASTMYVMNRATEDDNELDADTDLDDDGYSDDYSPDDSSANDSSSYDSGSSDSGSSDSGSSCSSSCSSCSSSD